MANRHMGTARSHNRVHRRRGGGKRTLTADRIADLEHAIHNRGPLVNPEAQKAHGKLREEMAKLADATATELGQFARQLSAARTEINTQRDHLYRLRLRVEKLERDLPAAVARESGERRDRDTLLDQRITRFIDRGWRARLRWIFTGK